MLIGQMVYSNNYWTNQKECKKKIIFDVNMQHFQNDINFTTNEHFIMLMVHGLISQNASFCYSNNDASSPKISWFQISVKSVKLFEYKKGLCILLYLTV